jgi:hypothetical protein
VESMMAHAIDPGRKSLCTSTSGCVFPDNRQDQAAIESGGRLTSAHCMERSSPAR